MKKWEIERQTGVTLGARLADERWAHQTEGLGGQLIMRRKNSLELSQSAYRTRRRKEAEQPLEGEPSPSAKNKRET